MPSPTDTFAATTDGVRALLADLTIDLNSRPSEAQVISWLDEFDADVARRLDALPALAAADPDAHAHFVLAARRLVHLGTAATTEDAAHPERAGRNESTYGSLLWERYTSGLAALAEELDEEVEEEGIDVTGAAGSPDGSFPDPTGWLAAEF